MIVRLQELRRRFLSSVLLGGILLLSSAHSLLAQVSESSDSSGTIDTPGTMAPQDFRPVVMLGFSVVFALMVTYMIVSHRKNASISEDVDLLKSRLKHLDS